MWAPQRHLFFLQGKSHVTILSACHKEVINYLSISHQSTLGATANIKLTLNLARKHARTNTGSRHKHTILGERHMRTDPTVYW